jgi:hypothetical protein
MKLTLLCPALALCVSLLSGQSAKPSPDSQSLSVSGGRTHSSELGFSFIMPSDWEVQDTAPMLPVIQQQAANKTTREDEKKDIGCMQVPLKANHGAPPSSVVVVGLTYECIGQHFTDSDLASFGGGVANSLKKTWIVVEPVYGAYMLGTHSVWIERANGSPIAHPESKRILEMVCSMLKKSAVCWMAFVVSDTDLQAFEQSRVSLDGETPIPLVPPTAIARKP